MGIYSVESIIVDAMTYSKRRNSCPPQAFGYANGQDWQSLLAQHGNFLQNRYIRTLHRGNDLSGQQANWPLLFHTVHGDNVELSQDRRQAKRGDSFCKGICFSNRPIAIGERVYIKFIDTSGSWSGVLRFGFTSTDPGTLRGPDLPRYACPDMTNKPGNWAKALGERYAIAGNELFFYFTRSGDVFYGVNGEEKGLFFSGVNTNTPVWSLLDIYGNTSCVEFSNPAPQPLNNMLTSSQSMGSNIAMQNNSSNSHVTSLTISDNRNNNRNSLPANLQLSRFHGASEFMPLPFHDFCGRNIRISPDKTVAMRSKEEYCNAYVFTSRPMRCGEKVVIHVQGVDRSFIGGLAFGFTSCDPATLKPEDLPDDADLLLDRLEYWVVNKDVCRSPEIDDELSFHLTKDGEVQYSRNNSKVSTLMHVDRTLPLWAFFDVYGNVQKVRVLGATVPQPPQPPRPFPRSRSTSGALSVTIPPPPPQRVSMNLQFGPFQPAMSRSVSQPAPLIPPSPSTPKNLYPSSSQQTSMPPTPSSINDNPIADNEVNECNVCYERPVNAVLYTCGHMCMCFECAQAVKQERNALCPICRQEIKDVIKIYRS